MSDRCIACLPPNRRQARWPGIACRLPIGRRWIFGLPPNVGGFGISSKIAVDVFLNVQYRLAKRAWLGSGRRFSDVSYRTGYDDGPRILDPGAFLCQMASTAPVIGMLFRF